MFHGPSWETPYRVPLRSPSSSSPKRLEVGSRVARQKDFSSGASSRLAPERTRKSIPIACRRRSVLLSPSRPSGRCRLSGETGTSAPITPATCTLPPSRKSKKYRSRAVDNGDIGNNRGTFPQRPESMSVGCRFVPPSLPPKACLNPLQRPPSPAISRASTRRSARRSSRPRARYWFSRVRARAKPLR